MSKLCLHAFPLAALLTLGCGETRDPDAGVPTTVDAASMDAGEGPLDARADHDASELDASELDASELDASANVAPDAQPPDDGGIDPMDASDDAGIAPMDASELDAGPPPPDSLLARLASEGHLMHPLAITELDDGDVVIVGRARALAGGAQDGLVLRLSSALDVRWARLVGGEADDVLNDVVALPGGDVIAAGATTDVSTGTSAPYLVRMGSDGSLVWSRRVPLETEPTSTPLAGFAAITRAPDGTLYAVGTVTRPALGLEAYVARFDEAGTMAAHAAVGVAASGGDDRGRAVVALDDGRPVIAIAYRPASLTRTVLVALADDLSLVSWAGEHRDDAGSIRSVLLTPNGAGFLYLMTRDPIEAGELRWMAGDGSVTRVVSTGRVRSLSADPLGLVLGGETTLDRAVLGAGSASLDATRYVQHVRPSGAPSCAIADLAGSPARAHRVALLRCSPVTDPSSRPFWIARVATDGLAATCPIEAGTGWIGDEAIATSLDPRTPRRAAPSVVPEASSTTGRPATITATRECDSGG